MARTHCCERRRGINGGKINANNGWRGKNSNEMGKQEQSEQRDKESENEQIEKKKKKQTKTLGFDVEPKEIHIFICVHVFEDHG